MIQLETIRTLLNYGDWANDRLLQTAGVLNDEQLDRPFDMGVGSLRKTLLHIYNGEYVWLQRWQGKTETKWPSEEEPVLISTLAERFRKNYADRDAFLAALMDADLARAVVYRDSKGSLFTAALGDMLMQGCVHSLHHRAQAVNMLRRVGADAPELDYMMRIRRPAQA